MPTWIFVGSVHPDTITISSESIDVRLQSGPDYPAGTVTVQIVGNRVIGSFKTDETISDVGCATIKSIVLDVASSICNALTIVQGGWSVVFVDTCIGPEGRLRMRFGNSLRYLKGAFEKYKINSDDIISININEKGFYLRFALDDIKSGLANPKFMRSHFYRAVESLRQSVGQHKGQMDRAAQWEVFRTELNIPRDRIDALIHHEERHADYERVVPMSSAEVEEKLEIIAEIISRYVGWFKVNLLARTGGTA